MATLREVKKRIRTVVSTPFVMVAVSILLLASSSYGFDGNRRAVVLGGGLGYAPTSGWSGKALDLTSSQVIDFDENKAGVGFNFLIGHGWDEKNLIVFEINMSRWVSDLLAYQKSTGQIERESIILQGYIGAVWYHYYGALGRSLFTALGLGQYRFITLNSSDFDQRAGTALLIGGGYEFARHWQLGGYLSVGASSASYGGWTFTDFKILVSAMAF